MTEPRQNAPEGRDEAGRPVYSGRKVRGAEIVLRTPLRRFIFFGGLVGIVVVVVLVRFLA